MVLWWISKTSFSMLILLIWDFTTTVLLGATTTTLLGFLPDSLVITSGCPLCDRITVLHLAHIASDHAPLLMDSTRLEKNGREARIFWFEPCWADFQEVKDINSSWWSDDASIDPLPISPRPVDLPSCWVTIMVIMVVGL